MLASGENPSDGSIAGGELRHVSNLPVNRSKQDVLPSASLLETRGVDNGRAAGNAL